MTSNEALQTWMAEAEQKMASLELELAKANSALIAAAQKTPTVETPLAYTIKEPKVALPEKFDGTRTKLRGFLNQLRLLFLANPSRYSGEPQRVALAGSLLQGKALAWFSPRFENNPTLANVTFTQFSNDLTAAFADIDEAAQAAIKIRRLVQGTQSASVYAADFQLLASSLEWGDAALLSQFQLNLSPEVKKMLIFYPRPTQLHDLINLAIQCDNRLAEARAEAKEVHRSSAVPPTSDAMQVDAIRTRPQRPPRTTPATPVIIPTAAPLAAPVATAAIATPVAATTATTGTRRGPLTPDERAHRIAQGLCLYCGLAGHLIAACPTKPGFPFRQ